MARTQQQAHGQQVAEALRAGHRARQGIWSESLAAGSKAFVENRKARSDIRAVIGRFETVVWLTA